MGKYHYDNQTDLTVLKVFMADLVTVEQLGVLASQFNLPGPEAEASADVYRLGLIIDIMVEGIRPAAICDAVVAITGAP